MGVLDDVDGWVRWVRPLALQARWDTWGQNAPAGAGAVRKLGAWPVWIKELILTRDARGHTYTVISPAVFASYLGQVTVSDSDLGGVEIKWSVDFVPRYAVMAPVVRAVLETAISRLLGRLVLAAQQSETHAGRRFG
jgi:hypothetical protein